MLYEQIFISIYQSQDKFAICFRLAQRFFICYTFPLPGLPGAGVKMSKYANLQMSKWRFFRHEPPYF